MRKSAISAVFPAALAAMALLHSAPAAAQSVSYVNDTGDDSNFCDFAVNFPTVVGHGPCRTLKRAVDQAISGGAVILSGPGALIRETITISKSVTITSDGGGETILSTPFGSSGAVILDIDAGRGDVVGLRGLIIDGGGIGSVGVLTRLASAVHVQNCVIRNFEGQNAWGIIHGPVAGTSKLFVSDTLIYNNGSTPGTGGLLVQPLGSGGVVATLDRVHLENNVVGLWVAGNLAVGNGSRVLIRDSVVTGNAGDGIIAISQSGRAPAFLLAEHTTSLHNASDGIHADGPHAIILLDDNVITQNGTGISATNGGQLISYGNNKNNNNIGPEGTPTGFFSQM